MDNAFERARAAYGTGAYDDATLEFLFPQLKESRDEQIRKAIIKSLDMPFPEDNLPGTDVAYKEAVAWLEKQKDHFRDDAKMVEQMDALLGAKGVLRNLQYNDWAKILEELYEQLKQL